MLPVPLFRVPVYGRSLARHTEIFKERRDRVLADRREVVLAIGGDPSKLRDPGDPTSWYPWKFNDVLAWIVVDFDGYQLRGRLFKRADRLSATYPRDPFKISDESALVNCVSDIPTARLFPELVEGLKDLCDQCGLPSQNMDLAGLDLLVTSIDWTKLASAIHP